MKKLPILISIFLIFSCSQKRENNKPKFEDFYQKYKKNVEQNPQFILDRLELAYFAKNSKNLDILGLINKIPDEQKNFKNFYKILFNQGGELSPTAENLKLLSLYQDDKNIQKNIAKIFSSTKNRDMEKAFFLLYGLNYKFSDDQLNEFSKNERLKQFIELDNIEHNDKTENKDIDLSIDDLELYLKIDSLIEIGDGSKLQEVIKLNKNLYKKLKTAKKDLKKLSYLKRKKRLKEEDEPKIEENEKIIESIKKSFNSIKNYRYFFSKYKKAGTIDKDKLLKTFYINKTPLNSKIAFYILKYISKESYPIRLLYYRYIVEKADPKVLKRYKSTFAKKLFYVKSNRYGERFLQYKIVKKDFPKWFKKLKWRYFLSEDNFFITPLKDNISHFVTKLEEKPEKLDNLKYFLYYPSKISSKVNSLCHKYNYRVGYSDKIKIGKESLSYILLKIALKGNIKIDEKCSSALSIRKLIYFDEILSYF